MLDIKFIRENKEEIKKAINNKNIKACGVGIDLEKTISRIRSKNITVAENNEADIFIAQLSESAKQKAMLLFEELRRSGFKVREHFIGCNLKAQLDEAEKAQVKFTLILGQKELLEGTILLKDMESGIQETINMKKLVNELDKRLHVG
jgi:histidyl-tRNA synthetase